MDWIPEVLVHGPLEQNSVSSSCIAKLLLVFQGNVPVSLLAAMTIPCVSCCLLSLPCTLCETELVIRAELGGALQECFSFGNFLKIDLILKQ